MERVGVRELRRNLGVYLRRARQGEALDVTDRGVPVAALVPLSTPSETLERLIRAGRVRPATRPGGRFRVPNGPVATSGTDALTAQHDER